MIFDTHAHYDDSAYDEDRDILIEEMKKQGVQRILNASSDAQSVKDTIQIVDRYPHFYGAVGIHPSEIEELKQSFLDELLLQSRHQKIVAIGEIGLDYHYPTPKKELQKQWFGWQLDLCEETKLPVIIHSREACEDTLDILQPRKNVTGVVHCYSYSAETAKQYLNMGYYFGIGGVVTFQNAKKLKEVVEYVPMDRILLETDSPYLAPVPHRGTRNCSSYLNEVVATIAAIKKIEPKEVENITWNNANKLFQIITD